MRAWRIWERLARGREKTERSRPLLTLERSRDCKGFGSGWAAKRLVGADVLPSDDAGGEGTYVFVDNFR